MLTTWLTGWRKTTSPSARRERPRSRPRPPFRPCLEPFEDRLVLATRTWTGLGADANWMSAANWQNGLRPAANDDLVFPAGTQNLANSNNFPANTPFNSITLSGPGYTLAGNAITLGAAGLSSTVAGSNAVGLNLSLPTSRTVTTAANTSLDLRGVVVGGGGLTKAGPGTLLLSGASANTFQGATRVNDGTLLLNKSAGVKAVPGALVIGDGTGTDVVRLLANNQLDPFAAVTVNSSGQLDLSGSSTMISVLTMTGGSVTGTGVLTLNFNFNGNVTTNPSSKPAVISSGLSLGNGDRTFLVNQGSASSDLIISGVISAALAGTLIKAGAGTLELAGTNANTYSGTTEVDAGVLLLHKSAGVNAVPNRLLIGAGAGSQVVRLAADHQIADSSVVVISNGGLLDLNNHSDTIGPLELVSGRVMTGTGTLTLGGDVRATSATQFNPARISGLLSLGSATRTFNVLQGPSHPDLIIEAVIGGNSGVGLTKTGSGAMVVGDRPANTYTGTTTVSAGEFLIAGDPQGGPAVVGPLVIGGGMEGATVQLLSSNKIANTVAVTVNTAGLLDLRGQNATIGPLTLAGGSVSTGTGTLTLGGDVTVPATSTLAQITGHLALGSATRTFNVLGNAQNPGLEVNAEIGGATAVGLTKAGGGTLQLGGTSANTYTGPTTVKAGTLELDTPGGNAVIGPLVIGDGMGGADADVVRLLNFNQIANNAAVTVTSSGLLDLNNQIDTIGPLTLTGGHVTTGIGTLTLNGNVTATSTAAGPATISGRLNTGKGTRLFTVNPGGSPEADLVIEGRNEAEAGLYKVGAGTLWFKGDNPFPVVATVNAGTLRVDGNHLNTRITLNAGTLQGAGTVGSIRTGQGAPTTVRLGTPLTTAVLDVTGSVTFDALATLEIKLKGGSPPVTPGVAFDQLNASGPRSGPVHLNGAQLKVLPTNFVVPTVGTVYRIITGPLTGEFANVPRSNSLLLVQLNATQKALFRVDYLSDAVHLVFLGLVG